MVFDFQSVILPTLIGVFGGLWGPLLLEKWKGGKEEVKKQIMMEADLSNLQEMLNSLSAKTEERSTL